MTSFSYEGIYLFLVEYLNLEFIQLFIYSYFTLKI